MRGNAPDPGMDRAAASSGPLTGIRVIELVQKGPGAFVTMMLADMGAEVIKIESPDRGKSSGSGGSAATSDRRERLANLANRGKKSVVLDLKTAEAQSVLHRLAARADVVVEGFRPGVTTRLGVDHPTLEEVNPRLVYCSLSSFGQDGPYRDLPGHDINFIGHAGILDLVGEAGGRPIVPPNLIADFGGAAMHAVAGIAMALFARERSGRGQHIDISYLDAAFSLISSTRPVRDQVAKGATAKRGVGALGGAFPYYGVYEAADGRYLTVGCVEPWLWENLCHALGRPDLIEAGCRPQDFTGSPTAIQLSCRRELEALFRTQGRDDWFDQLAGGNTCVGKVLDIGEAFDDPQLRHRGMVTSHIDPELGEVKGTGVAIRMSGTPGRPGRLAPWKGQHTESVLRDLCLSDQETGRPAGQPAPAAGDI